MPLIYAGMAIVALMAVPVVAGPEGPHTALWRTPDRTAVLGVVDTYRPEWVADPAALVDRGRGGPPGPGEWPANTAMLGLSRHSYTLATNRQIPSWLGKLFGPNRLTPAVAIVPSRRCSPSRWRFPAMSRFLAGIFAFGATLAISDRPSVDHSAALSPSLTGSALIACP